MESPGRIVIDKTGKGEIRAVDVVIDCRLEPHESVWILI